jgi:hypothetical protein
MTIESCDVLTVSCMCAIMYEWEMSGKQVNTYSTITSCIVAHCCDLNSGSECIEFIRMELITKVMALT